MATTTATKPPAPEADEGGAAGSGRKRLVLIAAPLVALLLGWYFLLGPGSGGKAEADTPKPPKAGEVIELDPITMNLADGRLLKVGLALQVVYEPKEYELSGSKALDEAITFLGQHTFEQLAVPATREEAKEELSKRVSERYHGDVMEVYFTEFVMQ